MKSANLVIEQMVNGRRVEIRKDSESTVRLEVKSNQVPKNEFVQGWPAMMGCVPRRTQEKNDQGGF